MFKENDMVYMVFHDGYHDYEYISGYFIKTGMFKKIEGISVIAINMSGKEIVMYSSKCFKTYDLAEEYVKEQISAEIENLNDEMLELKNKLNQPVKIIN